MSLWLALRLAVGRVSYGVRVSDRLTSVLGLQWLMYVMNEPRDLDNWLQKESKDRKLNPQVYGKRFKLTTSAATLAFLMTAPCIFVTLKCGPSRPLLSS